MPTYVQFSEEIGGPQWIFADYRYDVDPSGSGNITTAFSGVRTQHVVDGNLPLVTY